MGENFVRKLKQALAAAAAAAIMPSCALAAGQIFLDIDGVEGDATTRGFERQIELLSMSFGLGVADAKKTSCTSQDINVVKFIDRASADLIVAASLGARYPAATITFTRTGEGVVKVIQFDLTDVRVSSYSTGGSAGEVNFVESLTLGYSGLSGTVYNLKPDGTVTPEPFVVNCF